MVEKERANWEEKDGKGSKSKTMEKILDQKRKAREI